jgi:hypothetical protein
MEKLMQFRYVVPCAAALLAACAARPVQPVLPANLQPPDAPSVLTILAAKGVQIYECRARKDQPGAAEWAFVAPEAELFDGQGRRVGKHYAGPSWEADDGSKLAGSVKARADAPNADSIPWLLLSVRSVGAEGAFSKATYIQRINTLGGQPPAADACTPATLGKVERVGYTADYRLLGR